MQNSKNYRTLYLIQIVTIVILVLVLIYHLLSFLGIGPGAPHFYTSPGGPAPGGGYTSPPAHHVGLHTSSASQQAALVIPALALR